MSLDSEKRVELMDLVDRIVDRSGWTRLSEGVALFPGAESALLKPGSLVFDIDGVLIDTRSSFREVIPMTVRFYLETILGRDGDAMIMDPGDGDTFKKCGGFNNDWDISEAGLIHALWTFHDPVSAPPIESFQLQISLNNGGLEAARDVLRMMAGNSVARDVLSDVDRPILERIFKEFYVGGRRFREVFGDDPVYYFGPGWMERERPFVDREFIATAGRHPVGILTGRIPQETAVVVESLGLTGERSPDCIVTMDGNFPTKPDPAGLVHIATMLGERPLLYFGDNRDDLIALLGARRQIKDNDLHFVYCLTGAADLESVDWFASAGAEMITIELQDILSVMEL